MLALWLLACGGNDDAGVATDETSPPTVTADGDAESTTTTTPSDPLTLAFRPVLEQLPPEPTGHCASGLVGQHEPDDELVSCYRLGEGFDASTAIADATASEGQLDGWQISLTLTPDGIDRFNTIATACHERTAECPTGQVAIEIDGRVLSAPTVNQPTFDDGAIVISGQFTEAEADDLAARLG